MGLGKDLLKQQYQWQKQQHTILTLQWISWLKTHLMRGHTASKTTYSVQRPHERNGIKTRAIQLHTKLYSSREELEKTATFILWTKLSCSSKWKTEEQFFTQLSKHGHEHFHFVSGSLCVWHHDQGQHVWHKCPIYQLNLFCSSSVQSKPAWLHPVGLKTALNTLLLHRLWHNTMRPWNGT